MGCVSTISNRIHNIYSNIGIEMLQRNIRNKILLTAGSLVCLPFPAQFASPHYRPHSKSLKFNVKSPFELNSTVWVASSIQYLSDCNIRNTFGVLCVHVGGINRSFFTYRSLSCCGRKSPGLNTRWQHPSGSRGSQISVDKFRPEFCYGCYQTSRLQGGGFIHSGWIW